MDSDQQPIEQVRTIFSEAQERPAGAERDAYITEACGGDDALRQEVLSLLDAFDITDSFLSRDASGSAFSERLDLSGEMIGNYRLIELIGEGGFGEVYRAEQTEPFQREVALKIIKLGMDTKGVIARFTAERQALARMNHPNIAQVYDAGATETGRPYFVMELVRGVPILGYCDQHRLSVPERIELFRLVCSGVQHAHKKGILHRDLKPSNILVSEENETPVPKIIDFGVAKTLQNRLTSQSMQTLQDMLIGTPLYMSPEQLEPSTGKVDERSDVYSLGIILYELIAGATPLTHNTPTAMTIADMRATLHERDMPRPSKRFGTLGRKTTVIAKRRSIRPPALKRQLKGDLDWIVMKAIEQEPEHRYDDTISLEEDLHRYLNNKPVIAGKPGTGRRLKKYARRHKPGCLSAASVALTILIGAGIMTYSVRQLLPNPETLLEQRGWKLEKFYDMGKLRSNGFAIRPDGSVLIVNEWGTIPRGLYWAHKGGTASSADAFSIGSEYVDPEDAIELPEGIYVSVNTKYPHSGKILKVSPAGGAPEVFCDNPKIINPYTILAVPETFRGPNVNPGDLLIFDNAHGRPEKTTIWALNRSDASIRPLIGGSILNKSFLCGGFGPNGMLYAGLNTHDSDEVSIIRITPNGQARVVFNNYYPETGEKIAEHPKAVHPITGELFFGAQNCIYAFYPEKTTPTPVASVGATTIRWSPDGKQLYFIADNAIWTLSGPGIESDPVSTVAPSGLQRKSGTSSLPEQSAPPAFPVPPPETSRDTHFVDVNNMNQAPPYLSWETAANTIEQAVEVAAPGDTILINDGTYSVQKTLGINKAISLQSRNGPEHTILDAGQRCRILRVPAGNGPCSIKGLTLTGGYGHGGSGMWISGSEAVTVENCIIVGNQSFGGGAGGIAIFSKGTESFDVTIRNCIITNNQSITDGCGIRVYAPQSKAGTVQIVDCIVSGNSTESDGGGISCHAAGAQITISNCRVENNTAQGFGGGIQVYGKPTDDSLVIIKGCTVRNNRAGRRGGGVNATMEKKCQSTFLIEDCVVSGNSSIETGGGIRCFSYASSVRVTRCRVSQNTSAQGGGVMLGTKTVMTDSLIFENKATGGTGGGIRRGPPGGGTVINCTIVGNSSSESGGGTHIPKIINSIIYGNAAPQYPDIMPDTEVQFSCSMSLADGVDGNIKADPMFTDPTAENFQPLENSPCIDAGLGSEAPLDLAGTPRVVDGNGDGSAVVDMGAFEFQPL